MSETDPGRLPASKIELAVTIINDSPIYSKSPVLARRLLLLLFYYPHYCYPVNSPALAIILLSLLYLFASKSGKICTCHFMDSFSYLFVLLYVRLFFRLLINFL